MHFILSSCWGLFNKVCSTIVTKLSMTDLFKNHGKLYKHMEICFISSQVSHKSNTTNIKFKVKLNKIF